MLTDSFPATLDGLVSLGHMQDINIRPVLLRVLVDLFVGKPDHGTEAIKQFEEIVSRLLDEADDAARLIVADKLAQHALTPKKLLKRLIADRGAIAGTVLSHAELDGRTLQAAATLGSPDMAMTVAGRADLDASVARALAERPESDVLCALVDNPGAPIDGTLHRYLVRRARDDNTLAAKLLARGGDPADAAALFLSAGREQRLAILAAVRRHDLGRGTRADLGSSADEALAHIARLALLPGMEGLDFTLARALGFSTAQMDRVMDDPSGEPLAVALAALGATPQLAARVFILGNPAIGHSYDKVKGLVAIVETLSQRSALRIVAAMIDSPLPVRRTGGLQDERAVERPRAAEGTRSKPQRGEVRRETEIQKAG